MTIVVPLATTTASASAAANSFDSDIFGVSDTNLEFHDSATRAKDLDSISDVGAEWIRVEVKWSMVEGTKGVYNWSKYDPLIQDALARGLNVLAEIAYTPAWARVAPGTDDKYPPSAPADYASFCAQVVKRYGPQGVNTYEIWNEPNISGFWKPGPNPVAYTKLLKAAYPAIKGTDPEATVVLGGTAPFFSPGTQHADGINPVDFLEAVYANGGGGSFDAVGHHPYSWPAYPGEPKSWSGWHQTYGTSPSLRSVMSANGDADKKIWGTEWGAPTNGPTGAYVSEATQAEMVTKAYSLWGTYEWAGPLFTYQGRDRGTSTDTRENFFGLRRYDNSKKPAYTAYRDAVDNPNTEPPEDPEPGEDPGPGGETGGGPETGDPGGTSDPGGTGGSTPTETTVKGKGYGKGGKKPGGAARGKVSTIGEPTNARRAAAGGEVELTLYRKSGRGWRPVSDPRTTALDVRGRFRERLRSSRRKHRLGAFRIHARYLGTDGTMPSASRSRKFKLR